MENKHKILKVQVWAIYIFLSQSSHNIISELTHQVILSIHMLLSYLFKNIKFENFFLEILNKKVYWEC